MTDDLFGPLSSGAVVPDPAEHARFEFDDAPYVLGALDDDERVQYEAHLVRCPLCREQVNGLRGIADVLERADPSVWAPETLPETLLPRLLREAESYRRRRYWRTLTTGLVAACLLVALGVVALRELPSDSHDQVRTMQAVSDIGRQVRATVVLTKGNGGSNLRVTCNYVPTPPFPTGPIPTVYRLVVFNKAGEQQELPSWPPVPSIEVSAMSRWTPPNIGRIEIEDEHGTPLLRLTL
jgi:hypothetical protein